MAKRNLAYGERRCKYNNVTGQQQCRDDTQRNVTQRLLYAVAAHRCTSGKR